MAVIITTTNIINIVINQHLTIVINHNNNIIRIGISIGIIIGIIIGTRIDISINISIGISIGINISVSVSIILILFPPSMLAVSSDGAVTVFTSAFTHRTGGVLYV